MGEIHEEAMGSEEISTDDWLGDVCHDEVPSVNLSA